MPAKEESEKVLLHRIQTKTQWLVILLWRFQERKRYALLLPVKKKDFVGGGKVSLGSTSYFIFLSISLLFNWLRPPVAVIGFLGTTRASHHTLNRILLGPARVV